MQTIIKKGKKFLVVLCVVGILFMLDGLTKYIEKSRLPKFTTPQETAEYVYKKTPEAVILGTDSCFIFNRFFNREAEHMISPCLDGKYEIGSKIQSILFRGGTKPIAYINILQGESSNDLYIIVVGTGYPDKIKVHDNRETEFRLFFDEEQVEGTEYAPYFWAVGYLGTEIPDPYTVTVSDSEKSDSISVE